MAADDDSRWGHDVERREKEKIRRLVKRLGRYDYTRAIALHLLEQESDVDYHVEPLLASLLGYPEHHWRERTIAAWALGRMTLTPDQALSAVGPLCTTLENRQIGAVQRFSIRGLRATGWFFGSVFALTCLSIASVILDCMVGPSLGGFVDSLIKSLWFVVAMITLFSPLISLIVDEGRNNEVRTMAATSLGRLGRPEGIWALAGACHHSDTDLGLAAQTSLRRVLPALSADDYGRLPTQTVPNLCRLLDNPAYGYLIFDESFNRSVLEALEKIGDGRAVAPVERLAERSRRASLRTAAEQILPVLRERQRLEREAGRLLRPSSAPDTPAEVLLRPTVPTETPETLLLRPSERES